MKIRYPRNKLLGGILLIAGTAIGAGMLALPLKTAGAGLLPTTLLFVFGWLYMTIAGLLMLEANLWFKGDVNLITMTRQTIGLPGQIIAWLSLLLLLYAINVAYITECGSMIALTLNQNFNLSISDRAASIGFTLSLGLVIFAGTVLVDYLNRWLMIGLIAIYLLLLALATAHIEPSYLKIETTQYLPLAFPVIVTSFAYQFVIPSLKVYLNENTRDLVKTVLIGGSIPLLLYIFWTAIITGVIPLHGAAGLIHIAHDENPTSAMSLSLSDLFHAPWIPLIIHYFSLLALLTSFLGVTLSLSDFFSDAFTLKHDTKGRAIATILAIIPPLLIAMTYPDSFMVALGYAGVFVVILLGILPIFMVWVGRYRKKLTGPFRVPGGKITLLVMLTISILTISLHFAEHFDLLPEKFYMRSAIEDPTGETKPH